MDKFGRQATAVVDAMDDIKPEEREILLALHRELNGLKPRRGRATAFYNAVNR